MQYANTKVFPKEKLGLELLEHILAKYQQLNVMVYTTNPESLTPIIKLIKEHKGGFGVSNKLEGRSEFIECASALLKHQGTKIIPRGLIVNYYAEVTKRTSEKLFVYIQIFNFAPQPPKSGGRTTKSPPNLGDLGGVSVTNQASQTTSKRQKEILQLVCIKGYSYKTVV